MIGAGIASRLVELAPGMTSRGDGDGSQLESLALDREEHPDAASLTACLHAHAAYVRHRRADDGLSVGALALARLLVWANRAAMIGAPPELVWLGPATRAPDPAVGQHAIEAVCRVSLGDVTREARAVALARPTAHRQSR